jgi:predicted  nucleic acid-binding Zn-ribbon protein
LPYISAQYKIDVVSIRQLYQLQCLELEIEAKEQSLAKDQAKIGESQALRQAKANLTQAQAELEALSREQKSAEYAISDLSARMTITHESLYSGRVKNSKELQNLQHEHDTLKSQRDPLEEKVLSLMEQIEEARTKTTRSIVELSEVEILWQADQKTLQMEIATLKKMLAELNSQRDEALASIPKEELSLYNQIRQMRGWAVSRMEQGICNRCRLNLSSSEIQRARGGAIVQCSSCSRLLYLE